MTGAPRLPAPNLCPLGGTLRAGGFCPEPYPNLPVSWAPVSQSEPGLGDGRSRTKARAHEDLSFGHRTRQGSQFKTRQLVASTGSDQRCTNACDLVMSVYVQFC